MKIFLSIILIMMILSSCNNKNKDVRIGYYADGNIDFIKHYKDGELNGQTLWFYPNGKLYQVVNYKNGAQNGNSYLYYQSGSIANIRYWSDGKMKGYGNDFYDTSLWIIKSVVFFDNKGHKVYKKNYKTTGEFESEERSESNGFIMNNAK